MCYLLHAFLSIWLEWYFNYAYISLCVHGVVFFCAVLHIVAIVWEPWRHMSEPENWNVFYNVIVGLVTVLFHPVHSASCI